MCNGGNGRNIKIFAGAIGFRIAMLVLGMIIMTMNGEFETGISFANFLNSWKRWDANGYLSIAENGYGAWIENDMYICLVFYPLFPWIIRAVSRILGNYILSGLIVSAVCFAISCVFLDKLMNLEYSKDEAENAVLGMTVFPFAFFFGTIMTESLFMAISTAFFYYLRKHNWTAVMFLGFLACMTKNQGILLTLPVLLEILYSNHFCSLVRCREWGKIIKDVVWPGIKCVPMIGGMGVYLWINYVIAGDPFIFLEYQKKNWNNSLLSIWDTMKYIMDYAFHNWHTSSGICIWIPEMLLFFVYLFAIIYGIRRKTRPSYMIYLIVWFFLTYSSSWLISGGRYTLSAMPLFMLEGKLLSDHSRLKMPIYGVSFALMIIFYFGYLTGKQIM